MKEELKIQAISLRKHGYSLREISLKLNISKSTVSLWVRSLPLNKFATQRLGNTMVAARAKAIESNRLKKEVISLDIFEKVKKEINSIKRSFVLDKIFCSLLFWGEGSKGGSDLRIINSDPNLIRAFLILLRASFDLDENKFRAVLHLHQYHNIKKQKKYWSEITGLPTKSFSIYLKPNTGKNKKNDYPGCISLRYYDYKVALELKDYYKLFSESLRD